MSPGTSFQLCPSGVEAGGAGEDTGQEPGTGKRRETRALGSHRTGRQGVEDTHIDGIPLKYAQLQEELKLDLALLEELLHLGLGLVQLLQHRLDVVDGAVMGGLVTGDGRVPVRGWEGKRFQQHKQELNEKVSHC